MLTIWTILSIPSGNPNDWRNRWPHGAFASWKRPDIGLDIIRGYKFPWDQLEVPNLTENIKNCCDELVTKKTEL